MSQPTASETIALTAHCHCGTAHFSYAFPTSGLNLPLKSALCHCEDCRRSTGGLFGTYVVIPAERPDFSSLTEYRSSPNLTRYFCGKCGATVSNVEPTEWELAPGLFESISRDLLNRVQMFVDSSEDAGAAVWLPQELYGRPLKRYSRGRDSAEVSDEQLAVARSTARPSDPNKLHASCHCGAVRFYIKRPEADAQDNKHVGQKYKAAPCPCWSCRTTSGVEFMPWCYVPLLNIRALDSTPFNIYASSLTHYSSSDNVDRTFCRTCGAKVFYRRLDDTRPDIWDIAVGIFQGESTRLNDWLYWDPSELAFLDESTDAELCEALKCSIQAHHGVTATESNPQALPA